MTTEILDVRPFPQPQTAIECMILPLQAIFNGDYPMHIPQRLQSYMMTLFTRGKGQHLVDFHACPYQEKTLLFVAENQVHQWEINRENDGLVVAFSKGFLYKSSLERDLLDSYRIYDYALQSPTIALNDEGYQHFLPLFLELQQEFGEAASDPLRHEIMRNLLRTILLRAERLKRAQVQPTVLSHYQDFARFRERVEHDFPQTRNVKDYAKTLGYSPKKLNELSMAVLNKGAKVFIDERVLLEIKRLLIHTDLSIKEITERTGFDEPTNLVKFFKRYTQQTPSMSRAYLRDGLSGGAITQSHRLK
jgi:AraC family transcriptional regulator, transcriptional activator of pobA